MKKLALLLALMMIPCTAFGLEMMSDNALDGVSAQSGVAIAADDVQLFLNIDKIAWIDCDGYDSDYGYGGICSSDSGAAFTVSNFQLDVININMIGGRGTLGLTLTSDTKGTANAGMDEFGAPVLGKQTGSYSALSGSSCGQIPLFYDYGTNATVGCSLAGNSMRMGLDGYINTNPYLSGTSKALVGFHTKALTIDITAELPLMTPGWQANHGLTLTSLGGNVGGGGTQTVAGVLIGLPTMEIYINQMLLTPGITGKIGPNSQAVRDAVKNEGASFGTLEMDGITFSVLNGWVEIAPTGTK
jgi:hypothetical protein